MHDFLEQIEKHKDEFYRYVRRTVWDTAVTDDVFQSAVLAAWENYHKFRPGTNFRAWMYRILTNKCFVANRETSRMPKSLDDVPEPVFASMGSERSYQDVLADPESVLEQCGDEVQQAFRRLSTAQRACILLRGVEQFSYQEIAEIMGIPVGTVMTHLARGRAKLRGELLDYAVNQGIVRHTPKLMPRPSESGLDANRAGIGGTES